MKKDDVQLHSDRGPGMPALNVKVYHLGATAHQIAEQFGCDEHDAQKALELAFDHHRDRFWENVQNVADDVFGKGSTEVFSGGRSGGWLEVHGLQEVESWDAIALGKWTRFANLIRADIKYWTSAEALLETIEANEYYKHGSEPYNFIDRADGTTECIADLKADARKAGFGPVVRGDR